MKTLKKKEQCQVLDVSLHQFVSSQGQMAKVNLKNN